MSGVVVGMSRPRDTGPRVRWATAEAALRGVPLQQVHAWDLPVSVTVPLGPAEDVPAGTTSYVATGAPADVLGAVVSATDADLLVLGARTGAHRVPPVTLACLRASRCPVVVVPDVERPRQGVVVAAVCGTDASRAALRWAEHEAALRDARLVVVYAWQVPLTPHDVLHQDRAAAQEGRAADARLHGWVRATLGHDDLDLRAVRGGPLDELLEVGDGADLVVVGRGRAHVALGRLLHGSPGLDLSGLAPCPVAVVPAGSAVPSGEAQ